MRCRSAVDALHGHDFSWLLVVTSQSCWLRKAAQSSNLFAINPEFKIEEAMVCPNHFEINVDKDLKSVWPNVLQRLFFYGSSRFLKNNQIVMKIISEFISENSSTSQLIAVFLYWGVMSGRNLLLFIHIWSSLGVFGKRVKLSSSLSCLQLWHSGLEQELGWTLPYVLVATS